MRDEARWGCDRLPVVRRLLPTLLLTVVGASGGPLAPPGLQAQSARGEIRDAEGRALAEVYVALLDGERQPLATTRSKADGAFEIVAPAPGLYHLYLELLGYATLYDGPYALNATAPLEVTAIMHVAPIQLERMSVTGGVARLAAVGFYQRQSAGFGWFLERDDLARFEGRQLADAFRRIPRVQVRDPRPEFGSPAGLLRPEVYFWSASGPCRPTLFLDGVRAEIGGNDPRDPTLRLDDVLAPDLVEAVEVYTSPAQVPAQYGASGGCGVILIWTRHTQPD